MCGNNQGNCQAPSLRCLEDLRSTGEQILFEIGAQSGNQIYPTFVPVWLNFNLFCENLLQRKHFDNTVVAYPFHKWGWLKCASAVVDRTRSTIMDHPMQDMLLDFAGSRQAPDENPI